MERTNHMLCTNKLTPTHISFGVHGFLRIKYGIGIIASVCYLYRKIGLTLFSATYFSKYCGKLK